MNEVFDYKLKITHLTTCLQKMMNDLYAYGINAGMLNELKDLPRLFEKDKIPVDISLLTALDDPLVKPLIELIYAFDGHRALIMERSGFTEREMAEAFYRGEGEVHWPDFFMFKSAGYVNLAASILQYQQQVLISLFCLARQISESRMYSTETDRRRLQYPFGEALKKLNSSDPNVYLIMAMMMDAHESMTRVFEVAEAFQDR